MECSHATIADPVDADMLSVTSDAETLVSRPPGKTARDVARDQIRQARQYQQQIEHTTTSVVRKPIVAGTSKFYDTILREWDLFAADYRGSKDPRNLKTAKNFVLYFTQGRQGRNEPGGRLTVAYTYTAWKSFMAAWSRQHHTSFTKSHQDTILNFIKGGEAGSPSLSRKMRPKRNFTRDDFLACIMQLWQNDWYDFDHERYRVGLHLLLLLHCNTSARRAEYEREWTYADINVSVVWLDQAKQPQLVIDFQRTKAKGLQDWESEQPQHMLYELVDLPFYCNSVLFFMAAALADDALRDYHTWDSICDISKPDKKKHITLHWHPDKADWPIFPRSLRQGQLDHTRTSSSLTSKALVDLGYRAGFQDNVVLHAARREVLLQVDNYGYSCNERMRFAAHVNSDTYRRSYQTAMPMVDGQASYFHFQATSTELHDLRRSYGWSQNPYHQPMLKEALRQAARENVKDSKDSEDQDREASPVDAKERQKDYDLWRQQRDRLIREQNKQVESSEPHAQVYESNFSQARKLMPERDRLATSLFCEGSLRDVVGRKVMHDLIALCGTQTRKAHCATLNKSGLTCDICRIKCMPHEEHKWWSHVYHCRKRSEKNTGSFAEFCFLCFQWYDNHDDWAAHAQTHIDQPPLHCSMATFRQNVIRPGLCPACLGHGEYHQHLNLTNWKRHIQDHVLRGKSTACPHPGCRQLSAMNSRVTFLEHLADAHDIRLDKGKRPKALNASTMCDTAHQPTAVSFVHTDAAHFAKLGLHDRNVELGSQQPQQQRADEVDLVDCDVVDRLDETDEEILVSEQGDGPTRPGSPAARDDKDHHTSDGIKCTGAKIPQNRPTDSAREETCGIAEPISAVEHRFCSGGAQQERSRKKTNVMVIVPPVPDSWRNVPLMDDDGESIALSAGKAMSPRNIRTQSRRGRPRGSRNRATLRRERRLATLTKTTNP